MNGAPDWRDGENCFRCRTQFSLVARKHHCRNCGNIFCAKCSTQQIPLPKLNIEKNVRVCDGCYEKLATNKGETSSLVSKTSEESAKSSADTKKSTTAINKQASAPSELDLKEEEELQLALALSMSEEPVKINFPDCKPLEDSTTVSATTSSSSNAYNTSKVLQQSAIQHQNTSQVAPPITLQPNQSSQQNNSPTISFPSINSNALTAQPQSDNDSELFNFVAECQSAAEVFNNRVTSNKLRNRPVATDPAIQKQFLDLTNMQTRLLELIKEHDVQRFGLEAVQDKISQITDARAALDALREEHQEKLREEAAEAERQRHSKLALKLEMMRQKKSEMMQHQRDLALQRIQAQEVLLGQQQPHQQPFPQTPSKDPVTAVAPIFPPQPTTTIPFQQQSFQPNTTQHYEPPPPPITQASQLHHEQQAVPTKQEEEALLISFDD